MRRILPLLTAVTIGLFATAAIAQNTTDPNSDPGASSTGGKPKAPSAAEIKKMNTSDPNSAPGVSATGGKAKGPVAGEVKKMDTTDPNSAPGATAASAKKKHKKAMKNM